MNKRPKKSGASEEDDSGVEVYYREGEDEVEEPKLPPGVRLTAQGREGRLWGGAPCLPRAELLSLSLFSIKQWVTGCSSSASLPT